MHNKRMPRRHRIPASSRDARARAGLTVTRLRDPFLDPTGQLRSGLTSQWNATREHGQRRSRAHGLVAKLVAAPGSNPGAPDGGASQFDSGRDHFAFVAQVVVLPTFNRRVVGSSPTGGTSCAQQRHDQNYPIVGRLLPGVRRHRIHQGEMHPTNRRCRRRPGSPDHRDRLQRRGGRRAGVPGRALPARSAESGPNADAGGL